MSKQTRTVFIITKDEDGKLGLFENAGGANIHSQSVKEILSNFLDFQNYISSLNTALRIAEQSGDKEEANRLVDVITKLIRFRGKHYAIPASLAILEASGEKAGQDVDSPEKYEQVMKVR